MSDLSCKDCKYSYFQDYGYSNWTVEGTQFECLKSKHPEGSFDQFYGESPRLKFANECESYVAGYGIYIDCDMEDGPIENYTSDKEILKIWKEGGYR